jgi:hypothetical protein
MPGPESKGGRKHGHTPSTGANDWIDVPDVPFEDAPPLPQYGTDKRSKWHPWTVEWYADVSRMPHCVLWRQTDWRKLFDLARMKDAAYREGADAKTSQLAEIRHREDALGMDDKSRKNLKIRYVPAAVEDDGPDLRTEQQVSIDQDQAASTTAGKVTSLAERRAAIIKSA